MTAGRQSYILVDDIRITEGSCTGEGYIVDGTGTEPPVQPPTVPPPVTGNCNSIVTRARTYLPVFMYMYERSTLLKCKTEKQINF